jgi:hypothetical protein
VIEIHHGNLISLSCISFALGAMITGLLVWWFQGIRLNAATRNREELCERVWELRRQLAISRRHDD